MNPRKLFILLVTVAILLFLYIIYSSFNHVRIVIGPRSNKAIDVNLADINSSMGRIGTTRVGNVVKAVYTDLDQNKNVKREFGFERLLHESGNEWTIQKPYMNMIEKGFVCGITADTGKVQVGLVGGKPVPRDAQLSGNVIIHILPDKGAKISESYAYLDDINYVNEKSLFTTSGPVRFESADVEMRGKGLEIIYNPDQQRLELMHLLQMEYLRLKTYKDSVFAKNDTPQEKTKSSQSNSSPPPAKSGKSVSEKIQYYKCTLNKNVVINYGTQAITAQEVSISNLFLPKDRNGNSKGGEKASDPNHSVSATGNSPSAVSKDNKQFTPVNITCEGDIIVRPMEETVSVSNSQDFPQRTLEISGTPVVIKTSEPIGSHSDPAESKKRVLAQCGWLKYNLDLGVLDMFSRAQQFVSLMLENDGSKLETSDSLSWSIKDRKAIVRGPGTLFLPAGKASSKQHSDKARMDFGGTMNVAFADELSPKSIGIKSVNLEGGFTAAIQNDTSHLAADSAVFNFVNGNAISDANLDGNVNFDSPSGSLKTQKARLLFTNNAISQAALDGNVNFNSKSGSGSSRNAKVYFDKASSITQAEMNGDVKFDSETGSLKSEHTKVLFTKDTKGNVYASSVQSIGSVEIIPAKSKGEAAPRGVFHAQRIDYDVVQGYAAADGPVELTFHGSTGNDTNTPATITAKKKAEYFLSSNEVVFTGDVQGKMKGRANQYTEFSGDKLTAKLARSNSTKDKNDATGNSIEHISITGDIVKFESYQKPQDAVLGGIKLKCRKVDYDGIKDAVFASGGKDCFAIIDNSKAPRNAKASSFDLKGPCYAKLSDFDKLEWYMNDNRIIAQGIPAGMHIGYLPIEEKDKYGKKVQIDSSRVQIDLNQTPAGRKEIAALKATGGIHYQEDGSYEFFGNELSYDGSSVSIAGNSAKPCMVNGVIVDRIAYNLASGNIQTEGLHGSSVPLPPKKK